MGRSAMGGLGGPPMGYGAGGGMMRPGVGAQY